MKPSSGRRLTCRTKRVFAPCRLVIALLCIGLTVVNHSVAAQVQLKSGNVYLSAETTREFLEALRASPGAALHGLVAFSMHPTVEERSALQFAGLNVLSPLHGTTYRVRVEKKWLDKHQPAVSLPALSLLRLKAEDRVDPELRKRVPARGDTPMVDVDGNPAPITAHTVDVTLRVHVGVTAEQMKNVLQKAERSEKQSDETWLMTLTPVSLWETAEHDVVQWIDAGQRPFGPENDVTRKAVKADSVQNWVGGQAGGMAGRNVQVGLFDLGVDETHKDLGPRIVRDNSSGDREPTHHATHLAGIIAGDGTMSDKEDNRGVKNKGKPHQWRGMAPLAEVLDINRRRPNGPNGANAAMHLQYINDYGMDLSNHPYEMNVDGIYDNSAQTRDKIIRGDAMSEGELVPPRLHVTSAGNRARYFGLTKQMKNALIVGNWNTLNRKIHELTSVGPTFDGRIKPDLVAPGVLIWSTAVCRVSGVEPDNRCLDGGVRINRDNFYSPVSLGTSQASAVTAGAVALVLERYARTYKVNLDWNPPLPSTLRAVMVHTARDRLSDAKWFDFHGIAVWPKRGPDFVTGWGLIDVKAAVNTVAKRELREDVVTSTCERIKYSFDVPPGNKRNVRVTLAWDDVAADAALADPLPKLVNDLDLVLIDPDGNLHYPWQLDQKMSDAQANCGTAVTVERQFKEALKPVQGSGPPSALRGPDHLNNVEVVDAPALAGTWKAVILAFNVPQGPQRFSLVGAAFTLHR